MHPEDVDAANKWDMFDNMAQGQMTLRLDPTICNQVGATSAATWTNLANTFGTTGVSKIFGDFCTLVQFRMSGSQHPGAEIEQFNMHLQRLKSNQVDIPDSVTELMVLLALPAKWDHVSAIYLQGKTAIGQVSLSEVYQAVVAEFDRTGSGNQQHAHCITAVKRKGEHPKYKGAQNSNHSSAAQGEQGGSSKKKNCNKKSKGKGKAHSAVHPNSPNPFTLAAAVVQVKPRPVIALQPSRAPPNISHVVSFKPSRVTYSMAVAHGGSSFMGAPSEPAGHYAHHRTTQEIESNQRSLQVHAGLTCSQGGSSRLRAHHH